MSAVEPLGLRATRRGAVVRVAAVALGVVMFAAAVVGTVQAGRTAAVDDLDRALQTEAEANVAALSEYFDRARTVNLLLAHDTAVTRFAPGARLPGSAPAGAQAASEAMAYLEELYPGRISEACLIDATGTEIARVVDGTVAPAEELSTEEAETPFFAPTLALPEGRVHQSAPYVSPDTGKEVIANSTPLLTGAPRAWGLVHFEVTLDSFQPENGPGVRRDRSVSVVETTTGRVVLRDGVPVGDRRMGSVAPEGLRALLATPVTASATLSGSRLAVASLPRSPDNANSWAVVVSQPTSDLTGWSSSVGPAPIAMALGALLLLTVAGLSLRTSHHELRAAGLTDELTGLPNRRVLADRLEHALLLARRRGVAAACSSSTSTASRRSTTRSATTTATCCCAQVADRLTGVFRASDTVEPARAATSSRCCCRRSRTRRPPWRSRGAA